MDGPGISLFQGSDSLDIGTNSQEDEENEALEDEKRRNDELRDLISNAFDDLDDQSFANSSQQLSSIDTADQGDDVQFGSLDEYHNVESMPDRPNSDYQIEMNENPYEQSMRDSKQASDYNGSNKPLHFATKDSSSVFFGGGDTNVSAQHYKHCAKTSPAFTDLQSTGLYQCTLDNNNENVEHDDEKYLKADYSSMEQLKVLYEVRVREIQRLHDEVEMTKNHSKQMEMQLKRRLALMEAERERAVLSLNQSQNLLVTSKAQITDLEKQNAQQKNQIKELEEANFDLTTQLNIAKASVSDLQNRVSFLETNDSSRKKELENNSYVRLIEDRHRKEITCLQEEVQIAKVKLEKKEEEFVLLEKKVKEVTKSLEVTLADKTEVINRLARSLEESQARCEQLMSSQLGQENMELRLQLSGERSEKDNLLMKISTLQKSVEMLQSDIHNYEAVTRLGVLNVDSMQDSDSIVQLGMASGSRAGAKHDPISDVNAKLKDELKRSLIGQHIKRGEIKRLQMELETKEAKIQEMQLQESKYMAEADKYKAQIQSLLQQLRKEASTNITDPKLRCSSLEKELAVLQQELKYIQEEKERLNSEKEKFAKEVESVKSDNAKLFGQIEEIAKLKEKEKQQAIDHFQNEYLNFHDQALARVRAEKNEALEKEINELRKQLDDAHREVDEAKKVYLEMYANKADNTKGMSDTVDLINVLKEKLAQEKEAFSKFREKHGDIIKQKCEEIRKENAEAMKEVEEKSKSLYKKRVTEEIDKAKMEVVQELERNHQEQMDQHQIKVEEEILVNQKSLVDAEVAKIINEMVKDGAKKNDKDSDEKVTELYKECCRLRDELHSKEECWQKEIEKIKIAAEKENIEKLRDQQREIEEKLGQEFREQLRKAESTREHATKMLKEQLEAEQNAFLQKYEEKLHEYSLQVKSHSTRNVGTSPLCQENDEIDSDENIDSDHWKKLLEEREKVMEEIFSKKVVEAERKARLEAESLYSGNLDVFRTLMEGKAREVEEIRATMATERNRLMTALAEAKTAAADAELKAKESYKGVTIKNKDAEIEKLKQKVLFLSNELKNFEDKAAKEKDMMAQVIARWAAEVQELKLAKKNEDKKLIYVYKNYQKLKKTVVAYKLYIESKDKHLKIKHEELVGNFIRAINTVEERMKDASAKQDATRVQRIAALEASFEKKAEKFRKLNQMKAKETNILT